MGHDKVHPADGRQGYATVLGFAHHGPGHGVVVMLFRAGGKGQHFCRVITFLGQNVGDGDDACGQGACFVKDDGIHVVQGVQRRRAFKQHAGLARSVHAGAHGHGTGQLDRSRKSLRSVLRWRALRHG